MTSMINRACHSAASPSFARRSGTECCVTVFTRGPPLLASTDFCQWPKLVRLAFQPRCDPTDAAAGRTEPHLSQRRMHLHDRDTRVVDCCASNKQDNSGACISVRTSDKRRPQCE